MHTVHAVQTVCVALQVALVNSATLLVYQTKHAFLVSFFCKMAFMGFARFGASRGLVGLVAVAFLQAQAV